MCLRAGQCPAPTKGYRAYTSAVGAVSSPARKPSPGGRPLGLPYPKQETIFESPSYRWLNTVGVAHLGLPHSGTSPHMGNRGNDDWATAFGGPYMIFRILENTHRGDG